MLKIAVVMGSDSDLPVIKKSLGIFKKFDVPFEVRVISAHRTPHEAEHFASNAKQNGFGVIIGAAGKAAHLAGVLASKTPLPIIGIPVKSSTLDGLDSLLSTVQMPKGVPVATVAIDGAENAALLAIQMMSLKYPELREKMKAYKVKMEEEIMAIDAEFQNR